VSCADEIETGVAYFVDAKKVLLMPSLKMLRNTNILLLFTNKHLSNIKHVSSEE